VFTITIMAFTMIILVFTMRNNRVHDPIIPVFTINNFRVHDPSENARGVRVRTDGSKLLKIQSDEVFGTDR